MNESEDCPICGSGYEIITYFANDSIENSYVIRCPRCGLRTNKNSGKWEALNEWYKLTQQHERINVKKKNKIESIQMPLASESDLIKQNIDTMGDIVTQNRDILCKEIDFLKGQLVQFQDRAKNWYAKYVETDEFFTKKEKEFRLREAEIDRRVEEIKEREVMLNDEIDKQAKTRMEFWIERLENKFLFNIFFRNFFKNL